MRASEFQLIQDVIAGHTDVDEHALAAVAELEQRLERVKSLGGDFANIGFSSNIRELRHKATLAAVG